MKKPTPQGAEHVSPGWGLRAGWGPAGGQGAAGGDSGPSQGLQHEGGFLAETLQSLWQVRRRMSETLRARLTAPSTGGTSSAWPAHNRTRGSGSPQHAAPLQRAGRRHKAPSGRQPCYKLPPPHRSQGNGHRNLRHAVKPWEAQPQHRGRDGRASDGLGSISTLKSKADHEGGKDTKHGAHVPSRAGGDVPENTTKTPNKMKLNFSFIMRPKGEKIPKTFRRKTHLVPGEKSPASPSTHGIPREGEAWSQACEGPTGGWHGHSDGGSREELGATGPRPCADGHSSRRTSKPGTGCGRHGACEPSVPGVAPTLGTRSRQLRVEPCELRRLPRTGKELHIHHLHQLTLKYIKRPGKFIKL